MLSLFFPSSVFLIILDFIMLVFVSASRCLFLSIFAGFNFLQKIDLKSLDFPQIKDCNIDANTFKYKDLN